MHSPCHQTEPEPLPPFQFRRHARRLVLLMSIFVVVCLVVVAFLGYGEVWKALRSVSPLRLILAMLVMVVGWCSWALLYKVLLASLQKTQPFRHLIYLVLVGLTAVRLVPSAGASGIAVRLYFWRRSGIRSSEVLATLIVSEIAFYLGLVALLWVGLADLWMTEHLARGLIKPVVIVSVAVTVVIVVGALLLTSNIKAGGSARSIAAGIDTLLERLRRRWQFISPVRWSDLLIAIRTDLRGLARQPLHLLTAAAFALLWWLTNLASMAIVFSAIHAKAPWGALLVALVLAALAGSLAGFIASIGVHEATMLGVLTLVGMPIKETVLAIVVYRFIEFWLPIPLGVLCANLLLREIDPELPAEQPENL